MRKFCLVLILLLAFAVVGRAQTIESSIRIEGANGAPSCTPGQLCRARGFNFLRGYPPGFGWGNGATVTVYSVMPDGTQIRSPRAIPNIDRADFYPAAGSEGAVAYRFVGRYYDVQTGALNPPTPTFSPVIYPRGSFCYSRPSPGACNSFDGTLVFPRSVGLLSVTLEAAGTGAFSGDWTLVITDTASSETETFAIELPATAYPASSATYTDTFKLDVGRIPAGFYFAYVYRFAPNGTIVKSARVGIQIQ